MEKGIVIYTLHNKRLTAVILIIIKEEVDKEYSLIKFTKSKLNFRVFSYVENIVAPVDYPLYRKYQVAIFEREN